MWAARWAGGTLWGVVHRRVVSVSLRVESIVTSRTIPTLWCLPPATSATLIRLSAPTADLTLSRPIDRGFVERARPPHGHSGRKRGGSNARLSLRL